MNKKNNASSFVIRYLLLAFYASTAAAEELRAPDFKFVFKEFDVKGLISYRGAINRDREFMLRFRAPGDPGSLPRVTTFSSRGEFSVAVKHSSKQISWNHESVLKNYSRTVWMGSEPGGRTGGGEVSIIVNTAEEEEFEFGLEVKMEKIAIETLDDRTGKVAINPEQSYVWKFNNSQLNLPMVRVKIESGDRITCGMVAIQTVHEAFYDNEETIEHDSHRLTMMGDATVDVAMEQGSKYRDGFFIVALVLSDDRRCLPRNKANETLESDFKREKIVSITLLKERDNDNDFIYGVSVLCIIFAVGFMSVLGLVLIGKVPLTGTIHQWNTETTTEKREVDEVDGNASSHSKNSDHVVDGIINEVRSLANNATLSMEDSETAFREHVVTTMYKDFRRKKHNQNKSRRGEATDLHLSDLALTLDKELYSNMTRSSLYVSLIYLMGIFYAIPVVQLTWRDQQLYLEGELDKCYFNFDCMTLFMGIADFGRFFSNVSYILTGVLFTVIVKLRQRKYIQCINKKLEASDDGGVKPAVVRAKWLARKTGIPEQYGIAYGMGGALIMQGVLSASYHLCPSRVSVTYLLHFTVKLMHLEKELLFAH